MRIIKGSQLKERLMAGILEELEKIVEELLFLS